MLANVYLHCWKPRWDCKKKCCSVVANSAQANMDFTLQKVVLRVKTWFYIEWIATLHMEKYFQLSELQLCICRNPYVLMHLEVCTYKKSFDWKQKEECICKYYKLQVSIENRFSSVMKIIIFFQISIGNPPLYSCF